jgi:DNA processing protein
MDDSPGPDPDREELRCWLALTRAPALGGRELASLIDQFEPLTELFQLSAARLIALGMRRKAADYIASGHWDGVDKDLVWLQQPHNHLVTLRDPRYPPLLKEIGDPPPVLFVRGDPEVLQFPQLAMVGSRNPSSSGKETAYHFARQLAAAGLTITSGLAAGIDGASHRGALAAGATTVAVTGTGLDRVYPTYQQQLAQHVEERGALVSEFPLGTPPLAGNFPRRNRIISGLSVGTLVVEAAQRSGSLITARLAGEQGREVFAIPGSIHNPLSRGCHALIRQGAKLVENAGDVIEELAPLLASLSAPDQSPCNPQQNFRSNLDEEQLSLLDSMGFDPVAADQLIERSGLTADAVSSMLLLLELEGYVSSAPGGRYCRTGKAVVNPPSPTAVSGSDEEVCNKDPT